MSQQDHLGALLRQHAGDPVNKGDDFGIGAILAAIEQAMGDGGNLIADNSLAAPAKLPASITARKVKSHCSGGRSPIIDEYN